LKENDPFYTSAKFDGCRLTILSTSEGIELLSRTQAKGFDLTFAGNPGVIEPLSAKEADTLQEAMFIEWCAEHQCFHCVGNPKELYRWLLELRRD
jgi:hypothetical protein